MTQKIRTRGNIVKFDDLLGYTFGEFQCCFDDCYHQPAQAIKIPKRKNALYEMKCERCGRDYYEITFEDAENQQVITNFGHDYVEMKAAYDAWLKKTRRKKK